MGGFLAWPPCHCWKMKLHRYVSERPHWYQYHHRSLFVGLSLLWGRQSPCFVQRSEKRKNKNALRNRVWLTHEGRISPTLFASPEFDSATGLAGEANGIRQCKQKKHEMSIMNNWSDTIGDSIRGQKGNQYTRINSRMQSIRRFQMHMGSFTSLQRQD